MEAILLWVILALIGAGVLGGGIKISLNSVININRGNDDTTK
jgi:hypothetical protein